MNFDIFEEYLSNNLKVNDDKVFQEKIDLLLSSNKNKKKILIKQEKDKDKLRKEELQNKRKLKDETNEKKIDFILSDENSFEKYEKKLKEKEEEENFDIDDIFFPKITKEKENESSNVTNTEKLIKRENKEKDVEFIGINNYIKKDKTTYISNKLKGEKEMIDLKSGLQDQAANNKKNKMKTINKDSSKNKRIDDNIKKNILNEINKKEIKNDENEEDLIISLIQCPIHSCEKIKNENIIKNYNYKINKNNKKENEIHKTNNKENKKENESLLNIYKKEKEIQNKLQKIFLNNQNISNNDFFSEKNINNQFYDFDSGSKFLIKAEQIYLDELPDENKKLIWELDEKIRNVKKQIKDINYEKDNYNKMIEEKKKEQNEFESQKIKEEFEYERELINELRSVVNKFKMEIYKKDLELNNEDNKENSEEENEEINKLKEEYNDLQNELNIINKNNKKFIDDIQKKIMILKYDNEQMKEKIESYQQKEKIENFENKMPLKDKLSLLNNNRKKIKMFNSEDEQNIIIKNNYDNNIIKTSSKLNHLKELDFEFPDKYFNDQDENNKIIKHQFQLEGKTIKIYNNNKKEIIFPNNTKKQIFPDGYTLVFFSNGDRKEIIPNYKEIYYYKKDEVYQIEFSDGSKYIKYLKTGKIFHDGNLIN